MGICKYYLQGNCRFGDRCKFDHPGAQSQFGGNQQNQNRFGVLNNVNISDRDGQQGGAGQDFNIGLSPDIIKLDLTSDRPLWPFSVYGPGRAAPRQLIEGPAIEQSPEEMRLRYYAALRGGNPQQAAQEESQLLAQMDQQIQNIRNDLNGACKYVQDGANVHPNRIDHVTRANEPTIPPQQQQQQQSDAFAQGNAAFGRPSAFGSAANPTFGQPSAFGTPSVQQQGAFGRPSAFGAPMNQPTAFGSTSSLGATGGSPSFGRPAFGAPSAFGQASSSAFAAKQTSDPPAGSLAFGQPAFGQVTQPAGLGQALNQPLGSGTFAQQQTATNAFGRPTANAPAFGGTPASNTPGTAPQQSATGSFGQTAANIFSAPSVNVIGQQQQPSATAAPIVAANTNISTHTARGPDNKLTSWKGRPVQYIGDTPHYRRSDDDQWERIWFPDGAPPENPYCHAGLEACTEALNDAYAHLNSTGTFKDGIMPEEPPMYTAIGWDV